MVLYSVFHFVFFLFLLPLDPKILARQGNNLKWLFTIYSFFIPIVSLMVSVRTLEVSNVRVLEPFKHDFMTFNQPIKSTIHLLSEVEANVHDFLKNNTHTHASLD